MKIRHKLTGAFLGVMILLLGGEAVALVHAWHVREVMCVLGMSALGASAAVALGFGFAAPVERMARAARPLLGGALRGRATDELALLRSAFAALERRVGSRERELEAHHEQLKDVLRALPEGVCVLSHAAGQSLTLNRAAEELLDFPISSDGARSWAGMALIQSLLATPEPRQVETAFVHRSGRKIHVQVTTLPTRDRAGRITGNVAVIQDISAVKAKEARLQDAWEQERQIAEALQRSFMPRAMPDVPEFEFGDAYRPARHRERVGGDFYDAVPLAPQRLVFCIGDVSGKGLEAALYAAMARNMWRALLVEDARPGPLLERLNDALARYMEPEHFVTLITGTLDRRTGELQYAIAGHPAPLVRRAGGGCAALPGRGMVLGAMPGLRYETEEARLSAGDTLLLYTDGMSELRRGETMLEPEGLAEWLAEGPEEAPAALVQSLYERAREWSGDHLRDDVALLAIQCRVLPVAGEAGQASQSSAERAAA